MINLEKGVKVAQIAKVREKISNGEQEFENAEDAMEEIKEEGEKKEETNDNGDIEEVNEEINNEEGE